MAQTVEMILSLLLSVFFILVGFKVINPYKGSKSKEDLEYWYNKYSIYYKVGGILFFILMSISLVLRLSEYYL